MVLNVSATMVGASAATETGLVAEVGAATAAASAALVAVMPMGADLDSAQFAAALGAAGTAYIGTATEHVVNRSEFSAAQALSAATYTVADVAANTALAL